MIVPIGSMVMVYMDVSENSGTPKIIHFNRVFHYKPSILGYPYFWKHPYIYIYCIHIELNIPVFHECFGVHWCNSCLILLSYIILLLGTLVFGVALAHKNEDLNEANRMDTPWKFNAPDNLLKESSLPIFQASFFDCYLLS